MLIHDVDQIAHPTPKGARRILRVLVAFDGSDSAWAALDRAVDIAVSNHAQLTIAGVAPPPAWLAFGTSGMLTLPYTPDQLRRELDGEMLQHLAAARDEVPAPARPLRRRRSLRPGGHRPPPHRPVGAALPPQRHPRPALARRHLRARRQTLVAESSTLSRR